MPVAKIEVCRSRPIHEVEAMIDAVYLAQREALKVPEDDKQVRYIEHRREFCPVPPGKSENWTLVEITMFPGRSLEAKRRLYRGIVERFGALGIAPVDIMIILHEPPLEDWGLRGTPASELDLGFDLSV